MKIVNIMRNNIIILLSAMSLVMTSCTHSNEEKAEELVKKTLKGYLYYPDSYVPISTKVDSMFVDVTAIESIMKISDNIKDLVAKISICKSKIKFTKYSQCSREEYMRTKDKTISDLDKYTKKLSKQLTSLKESIAKYRKDEFTGWFVTHRFRCLNGTGSMTIPGEMIFFCDKEFTTCVCYETDRLENFAEILEVVDEATSDEDITDYFWQCSFLP